MGLRVTMLLHGDHHIIPYSPHVVDQLNLTPNELQHYLYVTPTYSNLVKPVSLLLFVEYLSQRLLQNLSPHQENRQPYQHRQYQRHHQSLHLPFCQPINLEYYHE